LRGLPEPPRVIDQLSDVEAAGKRADVIDTLERVTLHDCRHTNASLAIASRVNAKALSIYMGHASITQTLDRYGHLMPGSEAEAATLLDGYLSAGKG
jgi:integrase